MEYVIGKFVQTIEMALKAKSIPHRVATTEQDARLDVYSKGRIYCIEIYEAKDSFLYQLVTPEHLKEMLRVQINDGPFGSNERYLDFLIWKGNPDSDKRAEQGKLANESRGNNPVPLKEQAEGIREVINFIYQTEIQQTISPRIHSTFLWIMESLEEGLDMKFDRAKIKKVLYAKLEARTEAELELGLLDYINVHIKSDRYGIEVEFYLKKNEEDFIVFDITSYRL